MSITVSSATNAELTALWQGLDAINRVDYQGEWWSATQQALPALLAQVQAQAITNGIWPIQSVDF